MRIRNRQQRGLPDETYVELVRSLFRTLIPTSIMGVMYVFTAGLAVERHADRILLFLGLSGAAMSLVRVIVTVAFRHGTTVKEVSLATAAKAERWFATTYLAFAALLGLFASRALLVSDTEVQMVVAALVVGYAAGVAAGVSLRPHIAVPAVLLAVVPTALAAATGGNVAHAVLALVLLALLAGGIGSMLARYWSEVEKIGMRQTFASLARTDVLTGLPNRLALTEAFEREVSAHGPDRVAVHCLDLDRFKPVNDQFGHPVGDALLVKVADRLRSVTRQGDLVARLGGDEFVLLQTGVGHPGEAELMARRVVRSVGGTYDALGKRISVGVSLGYALPQGCGHDLPHLLSCADSALYHIKREGGGAARHVELPVALAS